MRPVMRLPCPAGLAPVEHGRVAFPRGSPGFRRRAEGRPPDWPREAAEQPCWRGRLSGPWAADRAVRPLQVKGVSVLHPDASQRVGGGSPKRRLVTLMAIHVEKGDLFV